MAVIGGFRSDLSITRKTDGNFGNKSLQIRESGQLILGSQGAFKS